MKIVKKINNKQLEIQVKNIDDKKIFYELLHQIKSLPGRQWDKQLKSWIVPASHYVLKKLNLWGFELPPDLDDLISNKKILDFFQCPLYNILKNNGGRENAKRCISKNKEAIGTIQNKSSKGETETSQIESKRIFDKIGSRSRMEKKGIRENKKSYALPRNKTEALERIERSSKEIWNELQRRQWTRTNRNNIVNGKNIDSSRIQEGIFNQNKACKIKLSKCSRCIQSRLCSYRYENSNRNRWNLSQINKTETNRQQEDKSIAKPWVDCLTLKALSCFPENSKYLIDILFQFQLEDVIKISCMQGRALLASEMGLGKTIQTIAYIELHSEFEYILIVCPASLKLNWQLEIKKWTNKESYIISGKKDENFYNHRILIINYDILKDYISLFNNLKIDLLIGDEIHYTKNMKSQRTKAFRQIAKNIKKIIALSGTPILNKPIEFFNILNILDNTTFNSWCRFVFIYCSSKRNKFIMPYNGASNIEKLHKIISKNIMIRRLKKDVMKELPEKLISIIPLELNNYEEYMFCFDNFKNWLWITEKRKIKIEALAKIEKLKQLIIIGKIEQINNWIDNFLETEKKLVIMCTHHSTIDILSAKYSDISVVYDGRCNDNQKNLSVKSFQENSNIKLFFGNIKAAGVGITLTASSDLCFIELDWTPSMHDQAMDRCHRIGQKNCVNIYYFIGKNTIEEDILKLLDEKRKILTKILDGKEIKQTDILSDLLKKINKNIEN